MYKVVEAVCGHTQGSVGLVAGGVTNVCTPEVVKKKSTPCSGWSQVFVLQNSRFVIVDNATF